MDTGAISDREAITAVLDRFEAEQRFALLNKPFEQATLRAAIDSLGLAPQG